MTEASVQKSPTNSLYAVLLRTSHDGSKIHDKGKHVYQLLNAWTMSYLMTFNSARSHRNDGQSKQRLGTIQKNSSSLHLPVKLACKDGQVHSDDGQVQLLQKKNVSNTQNKQTGESRTIHVENSNSTAALISMDEG